MEEKKITYSLRDTDSIIYKIKNCSHEKYLETSKNSKKHFNKELGLMENEISENINEVISLMSKCYSIQTVNDIIKQKSKGISKNHCKKYHNYEYFKKVLFNENKNKKLNFIVYL